MKKPLIALAVLATTTAASAQSTVTLSGIVKGGFGRTTYSHGATGNGSVTAMADGASRFIIGGREDLGGGTSAIFQIDTRFRLDDNGPAPTSSPLAGGNTFVGLNGGFGQLRMGKLDTHYCLGVDEHLVRATAFQAVSCGILSYVNGSTPAQAIALASRSVNVVRYDIPASLASGLAASVTYSTGPFGNDGGIGNAGQGSAKSATLGYTNGPLFLGASFWDAKSEDRNTTAARADQKSQSITARWNFGFAKVGVVYDVSAYDRAAAGSGVFIETKRSAWSIPLQYSTGPHAVMLTYSRANNTKVAGVTAANTGANLVTLGYDYALSKRTSVGVSYATMDNAAAGLYGFYAGGLFVNLPAPVAGQDQRQVYLGMRHAF